jgi:predicted nucleic acid-binding protein
LPEKDSPKAVKLRNDFRRDIHELIAPDIFPAEIAHALTRAERRKIIRPPQGTKRFLAVMRFPPVLYSYLSLLPKAFALSSALRVGAYDCLYVSLAEQEGCELVTADDKLIRNLRPHFPFILDLNALP